MPAPLDRVDWPIDTDRLRLRRATPGDADALFAIRSRPEVGEWVTSTWSDPDAFRRDYVDTPRFDKVVVIERDGAVVGELLIAVEDGWAQREIESAAAGAQAELGWVLDPEHQGHGYAAEAVTAAVTLCFTQLDVRRVVAHCFADNVASWRLMERIGMRREAHGVRDSLHRSRGWLDGYSYAVLADEWRIG